MSECILLEWAVPTGLALLSGALVVLIIEINEWFGRKEDKRQERLKNEKQQPAKENKKEAETGKGRFEVDARSAAGKL